MPSGLSYHTSLDRSIPNSWVSRAFLLLMWFIEIPVIKTNIVDPDQTPHFVASDLGLHSLSMSLLWNAKHKLVNNSVTYSNLMISTLGKIFSR